MNDAEHRQAATSSDTQAPVESVFSATGALWALFFSIALGMLSTGLLNPLLSIRAGLSGFSPQSVGIVMTGYFAGFVFSSKLTPVLIARVGHIRVLAAFASLASVSPLVHAVVVDPYVWFAGRLMTGFSMAGIYIVCESWLNARATNENRGSLLSVYMIIMVGSWASGPLLLNLGEPDSFELFVLASGLISLSLVPILLAATPVPTIDTPEKLGVLALYRLAPLSVAAAVGGGVAAGAIVGMAPTYGSMLKMSVPEISLFTTASLIGCVVTQWPIGWLSDRFDRRWVLTVVVFGCVAVAGVGSLGSDLPFLLQCALVGLLSGLIFPIYSLSIAHANDRLTTRQMMAASSTIVLINGVGATIGPTAVSYLIGLAGPGGFYLFFAVLFSMLGFYALYRMTRRAAVALDDQESVIMTTQAAGIAPVLTAESYYEVTSSSEDASYDEWLTETYEEEPKGPAEGVDIETNMPIDEPPKPEVRD
ncbi:MAG: MFS transporter [Rhodospirillales bacterium]